jgi:hypothetical protein
MIGCVGSGLVSNRARRHICTASRCTAPASCAGKNKCMLQPALMSAQGWITYMYKVTMRALAMCLGKHELPDSWSNVCCDRNCD